MVGYFAYDCLASGLWLHFVTSPDIALVPVIKGTTIRSTIEGQGDPAHGTLELKTLWSFNHGTSVGARFT